ncbi:Na+/H+ antiporter subunit E [Polymorphospora sp. NPDC051019]|uniref:Na+/H+ antiporter subunit E n=1 Tax=Polymorphospora sp. NPDC051019 TaxID=3155725 RepID=UPI0034243135
MTTTSPPPRATPRRWRDQMVAVVWLVVVWNLLWGDFTVGNVIGGLVVAVVVLVFFPLPRVTFGGRIRPFALLRFVLRFLADLITASIEVAGVALRPGYQPSSAIIAVRLRVHSDLNLTLTAEALSLVPGSLIVEADRSTGTLYVHVLDLAGPEAVERMRQEILELEARIIRATGSDAELRLLESGATGPGDSARKTDMAGEATATGKAGPAESTRKTGESTGKTGESTGETGKADQAGKAANSDDEGASR